jgi:hypothetical protein
MTINTISPDSSSRPPKLLDQLRGRIRLKHYSLRTEQAYVQWAKRYLFFHGMRHPAEMGKQEIEAFLTALAGCMGWFWSRYRSPLSGRSRKNPWG